MFLSLMNVKVNEKIYNNNGQLICEGEILNRKTKIEKYNENGKLKLETEFTNRKLNDQEIKEFAVLKKIDKFFIELKDILSIFSNNRMEEYYEINMLRFLNRFVFGVGTGNENDGNTSLLEILIAFNASIEGKTPEKKEYYD